MKISVLPRGLLLLALGGCAGNQPATIPAWQRDAIVEVESAASLAANHHLAEAETTIQSVIHSAHFGQLPSADQYRALELAASLAYSLKHTPLEYESRVRLVALPEATPTDRMQRLNAAARTRDTAEMRIALMAVAQQDPGQLHNINDDFVFRVLREVKKQLPPSSTQALLQALYTAHWKLKFDTEPSYSWADLALILLQQNKLKPAIDVASHVTNEYSLIAMRADRRFDPITAANPAQFDVDAALKRALEHFQSVMEKHPKALTPILAVIDTLREQQQYAASLALTDSVLAEIQSDTNPKQHYEDYDRLYVWVLDNRARDLRRLGRWDDAVAQLTTASTVTEEGRPNVSQVINLGDLYCDLNRPKNALEALNGLGPDTSAYGSMQAESVRLAAAVELGDAEQTAKSLSYITEHRTDAPLTYQHALLLTDKDDAAARWLIERLEDQDQRSTALLSIQDYATPAQTPQELLMSAHRRALLARPDVQTAINKVGRMERYNLEALQQ